MIVPKSFEVSPSGVLDMVRQETCGHGFVVTLIPVGDGWVEPVAKDCPSCAGRPSGLRRKPGSPPRRRWRE